MVSVSILSADFSNLKKDIKMISSSCADFIHVDIMDGVFVPDISFGSVILKVVQNYSTKPIDIHLMTYKPINYIKKIINYKVNSISIHYESCNDLYYLISFIKSYNIKIGVVINPHTPLHLLYDIMEFIDILTIMGVSPGFGGQRFIDFVYNKLIQAKKIIINNGLKTLIQIDGGVNLNNYKFLLSYGSDILVSGSCIFFNKNPLSVIKKIKYNN